jgi:hypothetical protein
VNYARRMRGFQLGTVNVAGEAHGFQLGVVNAGDTASGFRFSVVNVARETRGFQFGVVNVAKHDDGESFAIINVVGNGIHALDAYASDVFLTNLGFKLGGRHLYTQFGAGYSPGDAVAAGTQVYSHSTGRWGPTIAFGWRFFTEAGRLEHLDLEAGSATIYRLWGANGDAPGVSSLRLVAGVRLMPHLKAVAGLSANVAVGQKGSDADLSLGGPEITGHDGATTVRIYPGFVAGLEL